MSNELTPQEKQRQHEQKESRGKRFRFQEQCFLTANTYNLFDALALQERQNSWMHWTGTKYKVEQAAGNPDPKTGSKRTSGIYSYNHIVPLTSTEPNMLLNLLSKIKGTQEFLNLDSSILTQLKPIVEVYKVYPRIGITSGEPSENAVAGPYKVPMFLGEQIKDTDKPGLQSFEGKELASVEELFLDHNVLGNVMMQDLSFRFAGKHEALLNTVENVRFTLSYSSFNLYNYMFSHTWTNPEKNDDTKKLKWAYRDLASYSSRYLTKHEGATKDLEAATVETARGCASDNAGFVEDNFSDMSSMNNDYFEIQLVLRYDDEIDWNLMDLASPPGAGASSEALRGDDNFWLDDAKKESLKNFLRNSAVVLRLQLKQHTIRYNGFSSGADPELLIDYEFAAYIESSLNSADLDILKIAAKEEDLAKWEKNLGIARSLLSQVEKNKTTAEDAFDSDTDIRSTYSKLRNALQKESGGSDLKWLIFDPNKYGVEKGAMYIIPTEEDYETARGEHAVRRGPLRRSKKDYYNLNGLREGFEANAARTGTTPLGSILDQLVEHIKNYINQRKKETLIERYQGIFTWLVELERVYATDVSIDALGVEKTGVTSPVESEEDMAKERSKVLQNKKVAAKNIRKAKKIAGIEDAAKKAIKNLSKAQANKNLGSALDNSLSNPVISGATPSGRNRELATVYFTNVGDVVDIMAGLASWPHGLYRRRLGLIFGPVMGFNPGNDVMKPPLSLAYFPISLKRLVSFFVEHVIAAGKETYLLGDFVKDLVEHLILPSLGSRCIENVGQTDQKISVATFSSEMFDHKASNKKVPPFYPPRLYGTNKNIPAGLAALPGSGQELVRIDPPEPNSKHALAMNTTAARTWGSDTEVETLSWNGGDLTNLTAIPSDLPFEYIFNYMLFYITDKKPKRLVPHEEKENINKGIYYLHLGQMPSIVRSSVFQRENMDYVRESRALGHLTQTGGIGIRDVYRFSCTMFGNNIFKPGMLIFVDPTKDGSADFSDWKYLNIGGFYRIISVDHKALVGSDPSHVTSISAMWETFGSCPAPGIQTEKRLKIPRP